MRANADRKTVLILTAKPIGVSDTKDIVEINEIRDIFNTKYENHNYHLEISVESTIERIISELDTRAPHIVHIIGHASKKGLIVEQEGRAARLLNNSTLELIFKNYSKKMYCLILNTCDSVSQAISIKKYIPVVIATNGDLPNETAIKYSKTFYSTLCQKSFDGLKEAVDESYKLGCEACDSESLYSIYYQENTDKYPRKESPDELEGRTNTMKDNEIELLRQNRLSHWNDGHILRNIYVYSHTDATHFEAAIRVASERVNSGDIAFTTDRDYLENILEKVNHDKAIARHIHALIASLNFLG